MEGPGGDGSPIRIVIMGQGGVGKTAMVVRYRDDAFIEGYMPTIGDMYTVDVESPMGPRHCEIDDTAGQEAYADLKREKMSTGDGYLLVYSITDDTTFAKVDRLREEILRAQNGRMVPIFLVGTKADLKADRAVSEKERLAKARAWNCQSFEISAKTDRQGVKDVFEQMANAIAQIDSYKGMGGGGSVMGAGVTPADPLNARKKKGCSWL